tara:strand:+ start:232 stop:588 length:357 start_codon:yes stop_codon:yes gene_type:complete
MVLLDKIEGDLGVCEDGGRIKLNLDSAHYVEFVRSCKSFCRPGIPWDSINLEGEVRRIACEVEGCFLLKAARYENGFVIQPYTVYKKFRKNSVFCGTRYTKGRSKGRKEDMGRGRGKK